VAVENPSQSLAFFVRLKLNRVTDHEEVLPVRWEDNYFSLLPGEKRDIAALLRRPDVAGAKLELEIGGWNVEPTVVGAK
jgi:exo-1,4-beta-D-glucosaminidase